MILPRLLLWTTLQGTPTCACPCAPPGASLLPAPRPQAFQLNRDGRDLYRQRRWAEARQRYAAALAADPDFLGPRLNLATAHAQEGQFAEAVREATALVDRAFVPWAREVQEAADLAPLHTRPERHTLDAAIARAGAAWGAGLRGTLPFLARLRPPVRLPPATVTGVLHLGLEQEIFAWDPRTGSVRQVTADDGRVVGFVAPTDGQTLFYLRAGKVVRTPGQPDRLRDLSLRRLDLASMSLTSPLRLPGDVQQLQLAPAGAGWVQLLIRGDQGLQRWRSDGRRLEALGSPPAARQGRSRLPAAPGGSLTLDGAGATASRPLLWTAGACVVEARDLADARQLPAVQIRVTGRSPFALPAPHGAGLHGLPFPTTPPK
jgi:hypothetical protein